MDTIETFIQKFKAQFEYLDDHEVFLPDTIFKDLVSWDSLTSIMVIGMIDDEYGVNVDGNMLFSVDTISELFELICSKK